jgi:ABC-2 type transport system ATP-binding protein
MITIDNLTAGYRGSTVLHGISLSLEEGRIHGLVGLNGSGKTTLLRCIYGLIHSVSGGVKRDGAELNRRFMSFLETDLYFYHGITGGEYLSLFRSPGGNEFNMKEWADLFHLPLNGLVEHYSTGMKKKLALLGLIKTGKQVLLLDEPFNGLDLESARILQAVISRLREKGRTVLLTSHMLGTLTELCDAIHHLHEGRIRKSYTSGEAEQLREELFRELDARIGSRIDKLL